MTKLSRRVFLGSAPAAAAAAGVFGTFFSSAAEAAIKWDDTYNVIVIGAGGDRRDVPARVVGVGIRRRAGFPRPDLPRGRCGRGIVVADRGLDHGLSAALRVHRGHPPQRVVGVARRDGSLRRFRQAVVRLYSRGR